MHRLKSLYIEVPAARPGRPGAYVLAVLLVIVATGLRMAIEPLVNGVQYITFFPAVIITTLISGVRAGFLCMVLSAICAWIFVLPPVGSIDVTDWEQVTTIAFFVLVAGTDVLIIGAMRFAIQRYQDLSQTLEQRVKERTDELSSAQQSLAHAQKMDAVGQLTGGIAHDFNNMLAVVIGNLDMMRRRVVAGQTDVLRFLDNALDGAQRAAQLTQRLLAFARNQPLAPLVVDVNSLVRDMAELLRRALGENIKLEYVVAGGLWRAKVDPAQLESAIVNLAVNARDAMPDGGSLTIETENTYLDERYAVSRSEVRPGSYVVVAVSDTGVGMAPDVAARAIDPFFTTKETGKGTGLGLSQVYGFVKQSGGHMAIYSEEGRGTTVRLYLPRAVSKGDEIQAMREPAIDDVSLAGSFKETILVVEDEAHVRTMSVAALRELGYRVYEAASGPDALTLLDATPAVDLLFVDIVMPDMDGRQFANAAVERRPNLKVIYTTGYTRNSIVHDGTLDPDVALVSKPYTIDVLARKIRAVLDGKGPRASRF